MVKYEDVLDFIENRLNVKLLAFQEEMLKAMCEGKEFYCGRARGRRRMIINGYNLYMDEHPEEERITNYDKFFLIPDELKDDSHREYESRWDLPTTDNVYLIPNISDKPIKVCFEGENNWTFAPPNPNPNNEFEINFKRNLTEEEKEELINIINQVKSTN